VIGYAPHVDESLIDEASVSGCNEALARSVFFRRLPEILKKYE
ncbi:MAG TPA: response regulator, partial [Acidimicrobiaceae bacterium]|nr:response regulator [Acidimicrobiaceae bacterium]